MRTVVQILAVLVLLALGALGVVALARFKPEAQKKELPVQRRSVQVATVQPRDVRLRVATHGTVAPRVQAELVPEVSGRIAEISPNLNNGGFFAAGDVLLRIDPRDYELAIARSRADVARAATALALEEAEAETARADWRKLRPDETPPPLAVRQPQLEQARAELAAAEAALRKAELDLERTVIRAPFTGRVRNESVDVGQFVMRGTSIAQVYAVDYAEVRLPIPDEELAFIDLPLDYRDADAAQTGPEVVLRARFAGKEHAWTGRIVRTEGEIDPQSRMVRAVARVADPYGRGQDRSRPPLAVGMFVDAEILGREIHDAYELPRRVLYEGDVVLLVDDQNRLHPHAIEVIRRRRTTVIARGLEPGGRICTSRLEAFTDGMLIQPENGAAAEAAEGQGR